MSVAGLRALVLTYGSSGVHGALLDSLAAEAVGPEQVLIVHNPSRPGELPPAVPAGIEVLAAPHNLGYAAGMNLGLRRILASDGAGDGAGELILILTHDARLRPGGLAELLAAARRQPAYGVLGPVLLRTGTDTAYSYGGINRDNGSVGHRLAPPPAVDGIAACDWVDGGTMLVRTEALRAAGEFDERFWGYTEEADLCLRIVRAGYRVGVVLGASADQDPGGPKRPGPWAYLLTRNGLAYARRAVGARGVAYIAARALLVAGYELVRAGARAVRLRPGPAAEPLAVARGNVRGIVDFARGRWGPPPPGLPGAGDMSNVGG